MIPRWLLTLGKTALAAFLMWHFTAITVSALPDRSQFQWVQSLRGEVLPWTDPYSYWLGQWQNWGMFSESSVAQVYKHSYQVWDKEAKAWKTIEKLGYQELSPLVSTHETALLRTLEADTAWLSRERYLQLQCPRLGLAPGTWVRMGYEFFTMPLQDGEVFQPEKWEEWEPNWQPWDDPHWTKCPDPSSPMDTWPIPQDGTAT
ncbi:MAG: hypothetical protein KBC95_04390 [Candidatus Peribacteraceae bacterium]|nr:hypothetical protein [Candidatus Peribacteraceae bacterium]